MTKLEMPAEWEHHAATLMAWPQNRETWPDVRLERVERVYVEIISALTKFEKLFLIADSSIQPHISKLLSEPTFSQITFLDWPNNDVWARDFGPIVVKDSGNSDSFTYLNWGYNAWGGKYPPFDSDDNVPSLLGGLLGKKIITPPIILEGGSIDVNGNGLLLTTESVLLNKNRNPNYSKTQIEDILRRYLGVEHILWLGDGLVGDDTDGHIDDITRFVNQKTIFTAVAQSKSDPNYATLKTNAATLERYSRDFDLEIVEIPLPKTKIEGTTVDGSEYVPASYLNFYIINNAVLVPIYDKKFDDAVLQKFADYFPNRQIVGIPCGDLVWGQGSIHCITQQLY